MVSDKTLLYIGAHPDDESFGPGATLAHYSAAGVKVYYACATRGEAGTIDPQFLTSGLTTTGEVRWAELECAGKALGLAGIFHLGYRDSGMVGSADNDHPDALCNAPIEEVTERIVKIIREVTPQVILTHDPCGDYGHPDHIAVHQAATAAFHAAGEGNKFPKSGPPFQPMKLYYRVFPRKLLKTAVRLLPLFGQDPKRFGRNNDIDLTALAGENLPVNAIVSLDKCDLEARDKASACHRSQLEGGPPRRGLLKILDRITGRRDTFTRAHPPTIDKREKDLFERV
jgi:N-acetyl-1-D-myo-inositol-2-amino-2-deoxy-alpha-D-glucopyranoside deacetylase/mycothiol S-conjugate amidase